ncbi:MAG: PAS domain S-box protein [Chloroflexi bacterium]|nr:PAS domain S-box protein [Chloroflexota bacterium]
MAKKSILDAHLFNSYLEDVDDWIFSLDENGRFSNVNKKVCHDMGLEKSSIIGKQPMDFLEVEDKARIAATLDEISHNKSVDFAEVKVPGPDGRLFWLEVRGRILSRNNQVYGSIHIARDITERKQAAMTQQKLNREITLLYEASKRLGQSLNFPMIYQAIDEVITAVYDCSFLLLYRLDPTNRELICVHARQNGRPLDHTPVPLAMLGSQDEMRHGQSVYQEFVQLIRGETAVAAALPLPNLWPPNPQPPQAALLLPLKVGAEISGFIQAYLNQIPAFTSDDERFWEAFAQQAAIALANARLLAQRQYELQERQKAEMDALQQRAAAETLRQAAAILNSSLSLDVVLARILEQLRVAIPYDSASVQQKEGDQLVIRAAKGFSDDHALINMNFPITANLPNAHAFRTLAPLAVEDIRISYPAFVAQAKGYQANGVISWLGVPLVVDETVLGMITIDRNEKRPFSAEEIALVAAFADHASIALRNAHLYHEMEGYTARLEQAVANRTSELQRTTDEVQAILNNSPDAILLLSTDYTIERVNRAFETLFNYRSEEVLGRQPFSLAADAAAAPFRDICQKTLETGQPQRLEIIARRKDGRQVEVTAALAPVFEHTKITAVVCSLHDISAYKEIERLKDDFVSNVSHELRTPIANLKLHHDLIKLNPVKQDIYLERQEREIERLNIIIESLLRLSRLDQGRVEVNLTAVNLMDLAQDYVQDRLSQAESLGLTLRWIGDTQIPTAKADGRLLGQVIGILLTNALNYTPAGGQITLRGHTRQQAHRSWVGLSIQDTGPGIPSEEQTLVFSRFFRGQVGRASGAPGTGLGLAIAKEIITLQQGEIELLPSVAGQGSTFIIWLPVMAL